MISALTGTLAAVNEDRVELDVGPVRYELLVCAGEIEPLRPLLGRELTLHTLCYLEGDPNRFPSPGRKAVLRAVHHCQRYRSAEGAAVAGCAD